MKQRILVAIMFFLCILGCTSNKNLNTPKIIGTEKNDNLFVIDLDKEEEQLINYSSIFSSVKTIILETSQESLIGNNFKFSVFDKQLYVLNLSNPKDFLLFDDQGKFIKKIGRLGNGPGEYTRVFDFTIDPDNRFIYLLCDWVINKYSTDGTFIEYINLGRHVPYIQYAEGKLYIDSQGKNYLLEEMDCETGEIRYCLESSLYAKGWKETGWRVQGSPFRNTSAKSAKYAHMFMDTLVSLGPNGIVPFLVIKSKYLIDQEDLQKVAKMEPRNRGLEMMQTIHKNFCIHNYFEVNNKICFTYRERHGITSILLDTLSNSFQKVFMCNDLVFDKSVETAVGSYYSDSDGVYEMYSSYERFEKLRKEGKLAPDLDKREQLMALPEHANPVLFFYPND